MNRLLKNLVYHVPVLFSDRRFIELSYELHTGRALNLDNPKTFNEKIQWLKLNDRNPAYTKMVDKCQAKEFAADVIGSGHIIPTLGVYGSTDEIDWNILPEKFVLKCTHDSGGMVICRDKSRLDIAASKRKLEKALRNNFWFRQREWAYKNVEPRIICEKLMEDSRQRNGLTDYKFFCFNGRPQFMYVSDGLENHSTARISFADPDGNILPFSRKDYRTHENGTPMPSDIKSMKEIAGMLAQATESRFVRVDLYEIDGIIYFSELTFYPNGGFIPFEPEEWDAKLGALLEL